MGVRTREERPFRRWCSPMYGLNGFLRPARWGYAYSSVATTIPSISWTSMFLKGRRTGPPAGVPSGINLPPWQGHVKPNFVTSTRQPACVQAKSKATSAPPGSRRILMRLSPRLSTRCAAPTSELRHTMRRCRAALWGGRKKSMLMTARGATTATPSIRRRIFRRLWPSSGSLTSIMPQITPRCA
jgi:hypothetical protein